MSIDTGRGRIDEARQRGTIDRLTPAAKPGRTGELLAPFPSPESADQNKPRERNEPSGPEEDAREGTPGRSLFPAWLRRLRYYGLALLFVAVAVTLRLALWDVLSPTPGLVFYLAWVGAAAFGGLGPGLLATLASWLCIDLLFDSTPGQINFADPTSTARLLVLLAGGLVVSAVGEKMRRTRIRERRQGRELAELAQSLDREKKILQSVMNGAKNSHLVYLDRDFNFVRVNATYARTCGYTAEEMVGKNYLVLYPHAENEALFSRVRDTGVPVEVHDKPFVFPDQPERGVTYWDWTLTPVKNDSGYVEGLVFSLFETTRRKQAEEAIKQQADLLNLTHDTIFMCDARDRITFWNRGAEERYGWPAAEALGQVTHTLLATQFPKPREEILRDLHANGQWEGELVHRTRDGRRLTVASRWSLQRSSDGTPVAILEINNDITARKAAEETVRESEERYRTLFESSPDGIIFTDMEGRILRANPYYREMLGYPREELHALTYQQLTPQRWQEMEAAIVRDKIMSRGYSGVYEKEYIRKDGTVFPISIQVWLIRDAHGAPQGMWGIVRDITERKRAEEALREWNATLESRVAERTKELEQRARQLQKLTLEVTEAEERERKRLAEILHDDLQQVLAAAKFQVSLLGSRVKNNAESQEIAGQAGNLLIDAIAKSRSLSHELSAPALSRSDLGEAFEWLAEQMQKKHGFTVHVETRDQIEVASEPLRILLYKAAQELLFNVVKHAGVGEARLRVRRQRGRIRLSVSDHGQGFDPTEPGYNLGFGLLSIRERVGYLGGRLKIRSAIGKGSTFLISMPDSDAREPGLPYETPSAPNGVPATEEGHRK